jgi:formylmethanofuran dehydrogenase subunit E
MLQNRGGEFKMIQSIVEFFKNLPAKHCQHCGEQIEEQAECYGNVCHQCIGLKDLNS